jgi:hypothetical protein
MRESQRWRVYLPCDPIEAPKAADGQAVFKHDNLLARVLIKDCGGHGRALEILAEFMDRIQQNVSDVRLFIDQLTSTYDSVIPEEGNALAIIKSVMGNGDLPRDDKLLGGVCTPDEVSARGLIRFNLVHPYEDIPRKKFEIASQNINQFTQHFIAPSEEVIMDDEDVALETIIEQYSETDPAQIDFEEDKQCLWFQQMRPLICLRDFACMNFNRRTGLWRCFRY